jgi:MFS family permease
LNAFYFSRVPVNTLVEKGESMTIKKLASTKLFWLLLLLMICSGASEQAMIQWASVFAETALQTSGSAGELSKTVGDLLGPCLFAVLMGISRTFYAKFSEKIDLKKFMAGSGVLCIFSYMLASLSPEPVLALIGCALCGLSVGIMWPGTLSIAAGECPKGGTAMFALLALGGDLGCSLGPAAVGFVSGASGRGITAGIFTGAVFPALLIFGLVLFLRRRDINKI